MIYPKSLLLLIIFFIVPISSASTLIHNIKGYTTTEDGVLQFEGLIFDSSGRVERTLSLQATNILLKKETSIHTIDGQGKFLLPGLIDAHGHVLSYGKSLASVNLKGSLSIAEAVTRIALFAKKNPDQEWITGRGWNQVLWEGKKFPSAETLDSAIAQTPVVMERVDGHAIWVNSKAMEMAGISKDSLDPDGGELIRDKQGNPTGVLIDNAMDMVWRMIPDISMLRREAIINQALASLVSYGLTSVHDAGVDSLTIQTYKNIADKTNLPVRLYAMIGVDSPNYAELLSQGPQKSLFDDRLSVRSIKITIDGALGSRGAALDQPYSDRPDTKGLLLHSVKETEELTLEAMQAGFQVNSHAIGDRGNRLLLDIFAKYPEYRHLRHRIEHAQIVHVADIARFKALNVIPSMQPTHATSDKNMAKDRIGESRLKGAYAWRQFLNLGIAIASGSDFPVEPVNPFYGLHAAVTRQDRNNQPADGWRSEEKMTREEALRSFTLDAAYAAHQEKILGSLEPGKWADFILVDSDYFAVDEKDIWKIKVLQTWQAGKRVY